MSLPHGPELLGLTWMDVERYLDDDNRLLLVLGATEEHAHLSLGTDTLNAYAMARSAATAESVLLAPPLHFGHSLWAEAWPGTLSLRPATLACAIQDLARSAYAGGFRRLLFLSGHSGNVGAGFALQELLPGREDLRVDVYEWSMDPRIAELARSIREDGLDHANWAENRPTSRLAHAASPAEPREPPRLPLAGPYNMAPEAVRKAVPSGMFGRHAAADDAEVERLVTLTIELVRERLRALRDG